MRVRILLKENVVVKLLFLLFLFLLPLSFALLAFSLPALSLNLLFFLSLLLLLFALSTLLFGLLGPQLIIRIHAKSGVLDFLLGGLD